MFIYKNKYIICLYTQLVVNVFCLLVFLRLLKIFSIIKVKQRQNTVLSTCHQVGGTSLVVRWVVVLVGGVYDISGRGSHSGRWG